MLVGTLAIYFMNIDPPILGKRSIMNTPQSDTTDQSLILSPSYNLPEANGEYDDRLYTNTKTI